MSEVNDFKDLIIWQKGMDVAEKQKTLNSVGWVDERNPTFSSIFWVLHSLNPTYNYYNYHNFNTVQFKQKTLNSVGWVDEGNPIFSSIGWVLHSLNPTYNYFCSPFPVPSFKLQ